ncbi:nitrilase family protein [Dinghuibacter silviterrae]|uniref:Putative amidohydrolase n=1 Tax=Dinghuibacter silviterrae TaxID=1539049 RepID=A0A4R8DQF2_9BACT|nr:nitrilase family protein [Dinghuibacter silviterrae]TDX00372.1 putative amidohydrolase [Dinghuibacter silviterrae]
MDDIKVATAQFEHKSADKAYNLSVIDALSHKAAKNGAKMVVFHECSITGYTFARKLSREQMLDLAEHIPEGPSIRKLTQIASGRNIIVCAGLFEKDDAGNLYKAYVCVDHTGVLANYRKLHPFINPYLTPGDAYCVFDVHGWKIGILICYDNNIIENVRATKLLGADILLMPHVTMCTPSPRPGAGFVDPELWYNKDKNKLQEEFNGLKGRQWLMKWLPARAYDNALYCIFSNPIGMDDDQLRNGCSMILDPFGDVLAECTELGNDVVTATLTGEKLQQAGGTRYLKARRPSLYKDIIGADHASVQAVSWMSL